MRTDIVRTPYDDKGVLTMRVDETGQDAALRRLRITHVPEGSYLILLDGVNCTHKKASHPISQFSLHFDRTKDRINKICDAAVVQQLADRTRVSLIDLKSYSPTISKAKEQLDNSALFIEYVSKVNGFFCGNPQPIEISKRIVKAGMSSAPVGKKSPKGRECDDLMVISVALKSKEGSVAFARLFDR